MKEVDHLFGYLSAVSYIRFSSGGKMQGRVINGEYLWADHRADGNKLEVGSLNVRALHLLEW